MQIGYQQQSDQALELLAARGDGGAFGELYNRHFDRVYDFVFRMVQDADEAADIAQDTFLRAMKALKPGEKDASFSTWVFTIARNLALTRLGKRKATVGFGDPEQAEEEDEPGPVLHLVDEHRLGNPEEAARASDLARLVWDAVAFLNPKESSVLDLHLRQGMESAEIAEVMGISKGNAYTILSRLKDTFEEAVVALVMIRTARQKCGELDRLLREQSGPLVAPGVRRLVMRHIDACAVCQEERKKLLSPASLFGAFAMVPLPLAMKRGIADALAQQWPLHGPAAAGAGSAGAGVQGLGSRLSGYPRSLGRMGMKQVRNFTVTWPYRTARWRLLAAAIFLAALFGIGGGGTLIAATRGGREPTASVVAAVLVTPTSTPTATPTTTSSPAPTPSPMPTPEPTLTPTPPVPAPTLSPTPSPLPTALLEEPASRCEQSAAVSESGDAAQDTALANQLIALTNQRRAEHGLKEMTLNWDLQAAAQQHAVFVLRSRWWVDHRKDFAIHCQPDGSDMYWRARCAGPPPTYVPTPVIYGAVSCDGYPPALIGENVAFGSIGWPDVFSDLISGEDPATKDFVAMGLACYTRSDLNEYACVQVIAGEPLQVTP